MGSHKTYAKCTKLYDLKHIQKKDISKMSKRELKRKSKRQEQKNIKYVSKTIKKDKTNKILTTEDLYELMFIIIIIVVMISGTFGG